MLIFFWGFLSFFLPSSWSGARPRQGQPEGLKAERNDGGGIQFGLIASVNTSAGVLLSKEEYFRSSL